MQKGLANVKIEIGEIIQRGANIKTRENKNCKNETHPTFTFRKFFESILEMKVVTKNALNFASLCNILYFRLAVGNHQNNN